MRSKLLAPVALVGVLLLASHAWAPPPPRPPAPPPPPPPRPTPIPPRPSPTPSRPPIVIGGTGARPPIGSAKPGFGKTFEAARGRSAAEAAALLRTQGALLARSERAAMLNTVAHQMLRQQQAASLADLRKLRADWQAIGPGAGLDPIVAMELEAAESAAERLLLAEILQLVGAGRFTPAADKIAALESPRHLPAGVVQVLPDLRDELKRAGPLLRMRELLNEKNITLEVVWAPVADVPLKQLPDAVVRAAKGWNALIGTRELLSGEIRAGGVAHTLDDFERNLKAVTSTGGPQLAGKLRAEFAARLFLDGRPQDATKLLDGDVDPVHAAAVLADLRAAVLGRGEFTVPQVAALVPAARAEPPACAVAMLPPEQLKQWKSPARKPGVTTADGAIANAREQLKVAVTGEGDAASAKVTAAAEKVRAALAAEAAPLAAFLEKVEAVRGKPFANPVERQLAAVAGARGSTVAETIGVLAADADRPASAARLCAAMPVCTNPGAFAATVEVASRAPAAFTAHPDAGFRVPSVATRARVREAVAATLDAWARQVVAGAMVAYPGAESIEAEVARRLGVEPGAVVRGEVVRAVFDVCCDWADDHTRLSALARTLDEVIRDIEAGRYANGAEQDETFALAKAKRTGVQIDRKRRELGVGAGVVVLGAYGAEAQFAREWLRAQAESERSWRAAAAGARAKLDGK